MQLVGKIKVLIKLIRKILVYYYPVFFTYWDLPSYSIINKHKFTLGEYYLDLIPKYYYPGNFSPVGVPLYKDLSDGTETYHPTVICNYALAVFALMNQERFTEERLNRQFLIQADWLVNNQRKLKKGFGWYLDYKIEKYGLRYPWISALTQGEAISVLCRAYEFSKDDIYLSAARRAIEPFYYNVSEGGLVNHFKDIMIFEEYPSEKVNAVLNGFVFAILGIYDLHFITQDKAEKELYNSAISSIKKILKYYDIGYWSQYNLFNFPSEFPASYGYHILHTEQMLVLYTLTEDRLFLEFYEKWKSYENDFLARSKALTRRVLCEINYRNHQENSMSSSGCK